MLYKLFIGYLVMIKGDSNVYGFVLLFKNFLVLLEFDKLEDYYLKCFLEKNEY